MTRINKCSINEAIVFDIQRYSIHDGPGIRTVVFLKGCPMKCLWCCNPESQSKWPEVEFNINMCVGCGNCNTVCKQDAIDKSDSYIYKIDKTKCIDCGDCSRECSPKALRVIGRKIEVSDLITEIKKDSKYYRSSGGGVTLSGGEPLLWIDFCEIFLKSCYDFGIHTVIETTGSVPTEYIDRIKDYVSLFLYDIKSMYQERHIAFTGVSNELPVQNIIYLRECGKNVVMRIPLIPEHNFNKEELESMFILASELGLEEINLMPYHNLGQIKYERLCRPYSLMNLRSLKFAEDFEKQMEQYRYIFERNKGIQVTVGG